MLTVDSKVFLTRSEIAVKLGVIYPTVDRLMNQHAIPHVGTLGRARVYDAAAVERVRELIRRRETAAAV